MSITFVHTADWQLGKPFAGVEDLAKRALLQHERLRAVERLGEVARQKEARFVVVAGDLFDSPQPTQATVATACSAIGGIGLPVFVIPGNHDHGGPDSLWEQDFFRRESARLAPNLTVLLAPVPTPVDGAVLLPCPLVRRQDAADPTAWLRVPGALAEVAGDLPRLVLAHGSVLNFGPAPTDDDEAEGPANLIDLAGLPAAEIDYVALGDWHGTKAVGPAAWYAGTPELDRFVKGGDHDPGNVLVVTATRGGPPRVELVRPAQVGWHELEFDFLAGQGPDQLAARVEALVGNRANRDLLRLRLGGNLSLGETRRLDELLEAWEARLLRVKLSRQVGLVPTEDELGSLTQRAADPLIAQVARQLVTEAAAGGEGAEIARLALRELYVALRHP